MVQASCQWEYSSARARARAYRRIFPFGPRPAVQPNYDRGVTASKVCNCHSSCAVTVKERSGHSGGAFSWPAGRASERQLSDYESESERDSCDRERDREHAPAYATATAGTATGRHCGRWHLRFEVSVSSVCVARREGLRRTATRARRYSITLFAKCECRGVASLAALTPQRRC